MCAFPIALIVPMSAALLAQAAQYSTFGAGCAGSMPVTSLTPLTLPVLGYSLAVDLDNLPTGTAVMFTGSSNASSSMGALPMALGGLGMPGCMVRVSLDAWALATGAGNHATCTLAVPPTPFLIGMTLYQQAAVFDPLAGNAAGWVASDATAMTIGLRGLPIGGTPLANMLPIAAGTFRMGSASGLGTASPDHTVTITSPFWMGRYEVTQAEYQAVMNTNPSAFQGISWPNSASRPVDHVNWNDAMAYCAALTAAERAAGRVPVGVPRTGCRPKRSGNTPAGPGPLRSSTSATRWLARRDSPMHWNATGGVGGALFGQGRLAEAEPLLVESIERRPRPAPDPEHWGPPIRRLSLQWLIELYERQGMLDRAAHYRAILEPEDK